MITPCETTRKLAELARTVHLWRTTPFNWGDGNCLMAIGDHVNRLHPGLDCCAAWRGKVLREADARAFLADGGGAERMVRAEMGRVGLAATQDPEPGDIIVAEFEGGIGGLKTVSGVCFRAAHGVTEIRDGLLPGVVGWRL